MIDADLDTIKRSADLLDLALANTVLVPKSRNRPLGEHAGPCPFCGGEDRFVVWPTGKADGTPPMWMCRKCQPDGGTVIDYVMRRDGLTVAEAIAALSDTAAAPMPITRVMPRPVEVVQDELERAERLADYWTRRADGLRQELAQHPEVVSDLERQGISEDAARFFGFGYARHQSGPRSLVMPWRYRHEGREIVTGVQYRAILGDRFDGGDPRYRWRYGSRGVALFNGDAVLHPVDSTLLILEGAKKAAALWSHGIVSVTAIASKTCWDPKWSAHLGRFDRVVFALDPDAEADAVAAAHTVPGSYVARLPMKPDDLLVYTGGDVDLIWTYIERARRVV